jgi:RNA polymerase sigma-70 factor (sigma-E family)
MDSYAEDFEAYVRARTPALLRSAYLLSGDQHRAEDLVQDALISTHRAWRRISDPDAYARKIMYHLHISWWRRRGKGREVVTGEVPEPAWGAATEDNGLADRVTLDRALAGLPPRQRAVIVLRYYEDLTAAQAAEVLGVTLGTIKSQTARALSRLRYSALRLGDVAR